MKRRSPFAEPGPDLRMEFGEKLQTFFGMILGYVSFCADLAAGQNYAEHDDTWWLRLTLVIAFLPSMFHCIAQIFTIYKQPADPHVSKRFYLLIYIHGVYTILQL